MLLTLLPIPLLLTIQDGLALLEKGDGVSVGHTRLYADHQGLGLTHVLDVWAVLADLNAQRVQMCVCAKGLGG